MYLQIVRKFYSDLLYFPVLLLDQVPFFPPKGKNSYNLTIKPGMCKRSIYRGPQKTNNKISKFMSNHFSFLDANFPFLAHLAKSKVS